jgi:DNA topoisomerase-1
MLNLTEDITISDKIIKTILHDPQKSAQAINLIYVHDNEPGISRQKKGKSFIYTIGRKRVADKELLNRIQKLVIPPAWEQVWICNSENGHLQATGIDLKKRKQYKYHSLWNSLRNHTKFYRLHQFGNSMPAIRQQIEKHLSLPGLPQEKVLAAVVCLMERTSIRVGNSMYEKLYGSFGLTTLKDKHVSIKGSNMQFMFKGKKGVSHKISLNSKRLANIVKQCRDIPGKELFQYYDEQGNHKCVDSGMVNQYLKTISGEDFTAKDFRTWAGSVHALLAFRELGSCESVTATKKNIVAALDLVATHLGNTRTVCRKYYVHPSIIDLYETKKLQAYLTELDAPEKTTNKTGLAAEERLLMKILEKEGLTLK